MLIAFSLNNLDYSDQATININISFMNKIQKLTAPSVGLLTVNASVNLYVSTWSTELNLYN